MRRRNFRKKTQEASADEFPGGQLPSTAAKAKTGVLSFDADEGQAQLESKPKRKGRKTEVSALPEGRLVTPAETGGEYTDEKLDQLRRQTVRMTPQKPDVTEPAIKITGTFKPVSGARVSPAFIPVNPPNAPTKDVREDDSGDHFIPPNTEMIEMAKAKRERLRQAQLAPDYVPLGGASNLLSQKDFKQSERHASSGSEEEEDHMRLQFIGTRSTEPKEEVDEEMGLDVIEDEDAVDSFVDTQIKKGIAATGASEVQKPQTRKATSLNQEEEVIVLPSVTRASISAIASQSYESIEQERAKLQEQQDETDENLRQTRHRMREALEGIQTVHEQSQAAEQQYADVQELREYMADLCACLKEKLAFVEAMEDHLQELYDQCSAKIDQDEIAQREDQELADAASNAVLETLAAGGSLEQAAGNADDVVRETQAAFVSEGADSQEKRRRRWECALDATATGEVVTEAAESSTAASIRSQLDEIAHAARELFSDALPEFASVAAITSRLSEFKAAYAKPYEMAYVAESLPALLAPFVRRDVLAWSPLHGSALGLEQQPWYQHLERFGDAAEEQLVPELVKRVVLPAAQKQIEKCWTPFAPNQSECVAEMLRELLVYVAVEDAEMQGLLQSIQRKLKDAASRSGVSPYPRPAVTASTAVQSVSELRFRLAENLVESLGCFLDVLPVAWLKEVMMREVLCEKLLPFLRGTLHQPAQALRKIVELFTRVPSVFCAADSCPGECMQISEVLNAAARSLEKRWTEVRGALEAEDLIAGFFEVLLRLEKDDVVKQLKAKLV